MIGNQLQPGTPDPDEGSTLPALHQGPGALAGFEAPPPPPPEQGVQWGRYMAALQRYKWLIIAVTVLGTAASVLATRFLHPEYTATATIYIEPRSEDAGPIRAEGLLQSYAWTELLTTGVVLDSVALKQMLFVSPANPKDSAAFRGFGLADSFYTGEYLLRIGRSGENWTLFTGSKRPIESGTAGDSIGRKVGLRWKPDPRALGRDREIRFSVVTPRDASTALALQLTSNMAQDGNFLRLALTGNDPRRLSRSLNAVIEQFVSVAADLKRRKLAILTETLEEQVQYSAEQLRDAESRLESYRVRTITLPNESAPIAAGLEATQPTVLTKFFQQKVDLEQLQQDRKALEDVLGRSTAAGALAVDAFQTIPAARNATDMNRALSELSGAEAELRALRYRYTDEHKPVRDLQDRINTLRTQTIPAYANALIQQLRAQETALQAQIGTQSRELQSIPTRTITEQRYFREMESAKALFLMLQTRYEEAKLALASAIPDVKILDPAIAPTRPTSNSAPRIILMGFLASLALAGALAILLDQLDKRFRYPDQVTRDLGLSILGAIPAIRKLRLGNQDPDEASQAVEAFRTIRLNLVHSYGAGPIRLTVSSPGPGEGKSLVCSNLALSFAEAGYKTLLMDGDIRRGELHRMFNVDRRPGLLDYLAGAAEVEDILRPTTHAGLTMLPCGTRRHHGPEMLGSGRMSELMAQLKNRFNVVIVDSPPLGAGIDPFVLGTATGHIVLVLRSGETDRQMAEEKLKLIDRLPIRMLGAVLNDIDTSATAYKYYSYVYGYAAEEEPSRLTAGT
ncbi:MAG TPA: polysaccharide biosynthesis tyrosine autokinase [Gemmatimonadales bacterium]|nr:polysaccharide biosynthesis tyrosine autokinase [Gemmatimonadales bacterium]